MDLPLCLNRCGSRFPTGSHHEHVQDQYFESTHTKGFSPTVWIFINTHIHTYSTLIHILIHTHPTCSWTVILMALCCGCSSAGNCRSETWPRCRSPHTLYMFTCSTWPSTQTRFWFLLWSRSKLFEFVQPYCSLIFTPCGLQILIAVAYHNKRPSTRHLAKKWSVS